MLEVSRDLAGTVTIVPTCGLSMWPGFLIISGLGFKGKNDILLLCKKGGPLSPPSLTRRLAEPEHTEGKYRLETGQSKPRNPELMHRLDTENVHVRSLY